jgi:hypothetical protein
MTKVEILDNRTTIEVEGAKERVGHKTITFKEGTSYFELMISDCNYDDLGSKMFPDGIMPEDFNKKVDMLNQLLEEIGPIIDAMDTDRGINKVTYDVEVDTVYYESEEV